MYGAVRNAYVTNNNKTSELLTRFEVAAAACKRVEQIEEGSVYFLSKEADPDGLDSAENIARAEMLSKKTPLAIMRVVKTDPDGTTYEEKVSIRDGVNTFTDLIAGNTN